MLEKKRGSSRRRFLRASDADTCDKPKDARDRLVTRCRGLGQQVSASHARACQVKVLSGRHSPSFEGGYTEFRLHELPPSLVK